jgi:hypothetical protein
MARPKAFDRSTTGQGLRISATAGELPENMLDIPDYALRDLISV